MAEGQLLSHILTTQVITTEPDFCKYLRLQSVVLFLSVSVNKISNFKKFEEIFSSVWFFDVIYFNVVVMDGKSGSAFV
jgi:hypothetical protein